MYTWRLHPDDILHRPMIKKHIAFNHNTGPLPLPPRKLSLSSQSALGTDLEHIPADRQIAFPLLLNHASHATQILILYWLSLYIHKNLRYPIFPSPFS